MKVTQVKDIVNQMTQEYLGQSDLVNEDLSNIVDVGKTLLSSVDDVENFTRKLIDRIGKVVFVDRPYSGRALSVLKDGWEYGSIVEKIDCGIPEAEDNDTWNLVDGQNYDQDTFHVPPVNSATFFNKKNTFDIAISTAEEQVKSAWTSASELNAFFSMINTMIETSMTIKTDALIGSTINNFMGAVINANKNVDLLGNYNTLAGTSLTPAEALMNTDFLKYASKEISLYVNHMGDVSTIFNLAGRVRHTPKDRLHLILLDEFAKSSDVYLQADTFHNELTKLPLFETVSYWQGSGTTYDITDTSTIDIKATAYDGSTVDVKKSYILGCAFDDEALGVWNTNRRVTKHYNARSEFINSWYKFDAHHFNDYRENMVVFTLG